MLACAPMGANKHYTLIAEVNPTIAIDIAYNNSAPFQSKKIIIQCPFLTSKVKNFHFFLKKG
jgi:hypothetical protein